MRVKIFFSKLLKIRGSFFLLCSLLTAGGCTSVEKRIENNAALFAGYPAEIQATLRQGKIAIGFDMHMVEIAKGKPNYVNLKQTVNGESTIWRYVRLRHYTRTVPTYGDGRRSPGWVDVTETEEFEVLRVEFTNGQVTAFEEVQ